MTDARDPYLAWTNRVVVALAVTCAALWVIGEGTYFVKAMTESHNVILAAANVRDLLTFLIQDVSASPEAAAHPYWYIHHPNLFAKILSLSLGGINLVLKGQVAVVLALNIAALVLVGAAFRRFSAAAALGAVIVAATSYGSFHFNAGDLCRGPLYLLLWPILYALVANPTLTDRRLNIVVAVGCALSILSDWGFGLFVVAFAFCWSALGRGRMPWRWFLLTVALPTTMALCVYELAVISAVGFDFFLFDAKVTYLGRLGVGDFLDYERLISQFHDNNVIVWPAQGRGTDSVLRLISTIAIMPLLNTGPAWVLLFPVVVAATASTLSRLRLGRVAWLSIGVAVALNIVGVVPLPVLTIILAGLALQLVHVPMTTAPRRLCGLVTAVLLGLIAPALIFPSFTMSFMIVGGRPPFPLLEMSAAALVAEFAASGLLARGIAFLTTREPRRYLTKISPASLAVGSALIAMVVEVGSSKEPLFGIPIELAIGAAILMGGAPLLAAVWFRAQLRVASVGPNWIAVLARWQVPVLLIVAAIVLALHKSANPVILGRFSPTYIILLSGVAICAVFASLIASVPGLRRRLSEALLKLLSVASDKPILRFSDRAAIAGCIIMLLVGSQIGWFLLSAAAHPPRPIPYARVLERPEFRGKSFLATSYEGLVWYSTRGWAYMTPANPPPAGAISKRFRHFADWKNDAKYLRPDYYLCDNTGFAYVRPGASFEHELVGEMSCKECTCRNVTEALIRQGHEAVIDGDDFSIVKFRWPNGN